MLPSWAHAGPVPYAIVAAGTTADFVTTCQAFRRGAVEKNPGLPTSCVAVGLAKVGLTAIQFWGIHRLQTSGHERRAFWTAVGVGSVSAGITIHNVGVAK